MLIPHLLTPLHICIDIDNVIGRSDDVMRDVIREVTDGRVDLHYQQVVEFDYRQCSDAKGSVITDQEWQKVHTEFSHPRNLWRVEPMDGAVAAILDLADYCSIHIATARLPIARRTTVEWLEALGLPVHNLHFLRHGEKHAALRIFNLTIEDDYDQAAAFARVQGTTSLLMRHPWNKGKPSSANLQWVDGWEDVKAAAGKIRR
jgi:uncharacterized HAD superfamily protein